MPKLPVISGKELLAALKRAGFVEVRQKGSHVSLQKITTEKTFKTVVPLHRELAKVYPLFYRHGETEKSILLSVF